MNRLPLTRLAVVGALVATAGCGPQKVPSQAPCSAEQRHFYLGAGCTPIAVCTCSGTDCDEGFATQGACEAAYRGCDADVTRCGGWFSGNRCEPNEFCAYRGIYGCGVTDGSSVCHPRPTACDDVLAPVCACDARTYSNECEANRAGQGVFAYSPCD